MVWQPPLVALQQPHSSMLQDVTLWEQLFGKVLRQLHLGVAICFVAAFREVCWLLQVADVAP